MSGSSHRTERKLATIVSADVKGSTALSRSIGLEEWWMIVTDLFDVMSEGVWLFRGRVEAYTGDGMIAVFEGHGAARDDVRRGCDAALWLRDAARRRAEKLRWERGLDVSVRIGVNSGEVLTGTIGSLHGRRFATNGYPVALAKRVEGLATAGQVFASEHTVELLGPDVRVRDMGTYDVKGAPPCLRVFELVGREWPSATQRA